LTVSAAFATRQVAHAKVMTVSAATIFFTVFIIGRFALASANWGAGRGFLFTADSGNASPAERMRCD
jgi:hypothetical protein